MREQAMMKGEAAVALLAVERFVADAPAAQIEPEQEKGRNQEHER